MSFELDMKELEFVVFVRGIERDRRPVDQPTGREEHAVDNRAWSCVTYRSVCGALVSRAEPRICTGRTYFTHGLAARPFRQDARESALCG